MTRAVMICKESRYLKKIMLNIWHLEKRILGQNPIIRVKFGQIILLDFIDYLLVSESLEIL